MQRITVDQNLRNVGYHAVDCRHFDPIRSISYPGQLPPMDQVRREFVGMELNSPSHLSSIFLMRNFLLILVNLLYK